MEDIRKRNEKKAKEIQARKKMYRDVFLQGAGAEVLEDLRKKCYMDYTTFSKDSLELAFREGIRSVYIYISNMTKEVKDV